MKIKEIKTFSARRQVGLFHVLDKIGLGDLVAPQLATVDVTLNAFYGVPNAQPHHQIPSKL